MRRGILTAVLVFIIYNYSYALDMGTVCYKDKCLQVEEAKELADKARGLQGREKIDEDKGMLFIFSEPENIAFWMKDMKMPIDMIWMDEKGTIQALHETVPPCATEKCLNYTSGKPTKYVLETAAGLAQKWGLKEGEVMKVSEKK
ncbi:MAG: DUF192 domain-containing protein [Candidatus Omnitrophica bacterium]|nr:DUF192 domain-containing protein [Candidatus Omnitrophota bacterium]